MDSPRRLDVVREPLRPIYVVWELTLACDQTCTHCGSRAGAAREEELTTAEAVDAAHQMAAMGAREVVLMGGEAYLYPGLLEVIAALKAAGVKPTMVTGGRGITAGLAKDLAAAGLAAASVSVDGLEETHDLQRAGPGSFASALAALGHLERAGIAIASNTNLNRHNQADLEPLYEELRARRIRAWQLQVTAPLGRASNRDQLILQPWDLLDLVPRIARLKERAFRDGILIQPANNLGYFGPEERKLRSLTPEGRDTWQGCQGGRYSMGLRSDGGVLPCCSLQFDGYVGGHLRQRNLRDIWDRTPELGFMRGHAADGLWGFCKTCPFAEVCLAGCTFTAHALMGRPGNNPYCHFRARTFAKQGQRERLVPHGDGRFELVIEALDAPDPLPQKRASRLKVRQV